MAASRSSASSGFGDMRTITPLLIVVGLLCVSVVLAFSLSKTSALYVVGGLAGLAIMTASFLNPKFGVALLVMSMLLSPEFGAGGGGGGTSVDTSRSVVIRLDDLLLVILCFSWFARTAVHKNLGLIMNNPLNRPIGLYVLSCVISTLLGFMAGNVRGKIGFFFVIRYIEYFVVFFLSINFLNSTRTIRRFLHIAFFTAVVVSIYGLSQIPLGVRVSAPFEGDFGEPNTMGGYLIVMMSLVGGQLIFARGLKKLGWWWGFLLLLTVPLLFTGSRASWLGLPAILLVFFILSHRKKHILIMVFLLTASANVIIPQSVKERLLFTFNQEKNMARQLKVGGVTLDTSTTARLESYKTSVDGWKKKPILGWGVTGFIFVDSQYIRTLVETGLVGMGAYLWLIWAYFMAGRRAMLTASDRFSRGLSIGYLGALAGLMMHGSGSNTFIILRIMEPWMLLTAMIIQIPLIQEQGDKRWEELEKNEHELLESLGYYEKIATALKEFDPELEDREALRNAGIHQDDAQQAPSAGDENGNSEEEDGRFQKKYTEYQAFLRREKIQQVRDEIEEQIQIHTSQPKFRRDQPGTRVVAGKPFQRRARTETAPAPAGKTDGVAGERDRSDGGARPMRVADMARQSGEDGGEAPVIRKAFQPIPRNRA